MEKTDRTVLRLELILTMIERTNARLASVSEDEFVDDHDEIDLLSFRLSQIGEMTGRLPTELKAQYPEIPWREIGGMRNLLVHEYLRVIPLRLYLTAKNDLSELEKACRAAMEQYRDPA
ncbi:HepT-like ribonuclease domain-containing protein [Alterisphingorhabdus coralli]|uniref:HepT-like ribonuclease domain-containing protein n=1 Tax=Alterisphingorhabdus coralli TaxID=3071408 RepID=A0AA97I1Q8_9SPHN|nr:HepT-like ribonuclease domain-containing protein [Parasphingorhabdus sp. SCSIO 66989]WOE75005.1 HepT-like ribonuclease domain-containing protein [Parasphingorhabdus sp. SCSIO 66989]